MDVERYRVLVCAIETGSLSAAADKLQYTPSGISRMIAALEEENGFPLLKRQHNGVSPTAECERMLPAVRRLLREGENCEQTAAQIRGLDIGTVTVGTAYSAFYPALARITSEFHNKYPGIQVQFKNGFSTELLNQLNMHQVDMCFISEREGEHEWLPVCRDEMVAWVAENHPLAALPALPVSAFAKEPYIETYPDEDIDNARVFARCGVIPDLRFSTMDSLATYYMVEAGLGLSMNNAMNGRAWSGAVRVLPLDPPQSVEIGIASGKNPTPAAEKFLEYLKTYMGENNGENIAFSAHLCHTDRESEEII